MSTTQIIRKFHRSSRGDTIVEVMITVAILAFVLGASYVAANRSLQSGVDSSLRSQASTAAQQQIEALKVIALSDPSRLNAYKVDNKPFCIDPSTTNFTDLGVSNPTCATSNSVQLVDSYSTATGAFTIKAQWPSARSDTIVNKTTLQYKTQNNFVDTTGAYAAPTEAGPAAINSSGVTINATPPIILPGNTTTLNWSTIYGITTSCTANTPSPNVGGWSGSLGASGSKPTVALSVDTTYPITCTRSLGGISDSNSTVVKVEWVNLYADASPIPYGGSTLLHWDSRYMNVNGCSLGAGALATSGQQSTGVLYVDQNYTLTCTGPAGPLSKTITVQVTGAPRVLSFTSAGGTSASSPIAYGASTTVSWTSQNTTGCYSAQFGWVGTSGSVSTGTLSTNTAYSIACYNAANVWTANSNITVYVSPPPTVTSLYASPNPIAYAAGSVIYWGSANATGCYSPQFGYVGTSGSYSTPALYGNTAYSLACYNSASVWSAYSSTTVSVNPAPTVSYFYPSPNPICYGCGSNIYWGSANATGCYSPQVGYIGTAGAWGTGALYGNTQYSVACYNSASAWSAYSYTTVSVNPPPPSYPPSYPPGYPPGYPPSYPPAYGCGFNRNQTYLDFGSIFMPKKFIGMFIC